MKKKNKVLLVMSLIGLIGSTCLSHTSQLIGKIKTTVNEFTKREGRLNKTSKRESLNAIGEIVLEELEKYVDTQKYHIQRIVEMKDFNDNTYVLVEFNPIGYAIYNVSNGDVVECAPTSYSPYLNSKTNDLYYLPWVGYFNKEVDKYSNLMSKKELKDNEVEAYKTQSVKFHNQSMKKVNETNVQRTLKGSRRNVVRPRKNASADSYSSSTLIYADNEVPYSWYFKRNLGDFVANDGDSCGYTAISFLLSYNEFFVSSGYFSQQQVEDYITAYHGSNFGLGVPKVSDSFLYVFGSNPGGATVYQLKTAINNFMSGKNKDYTVKMTNGLFTDVEKPIEDGYPCLYGGTFPDMIGGTVDHAVVVYGTYNDGRVLCHYGWEGYTQVIMSGVSLFAESGALAIYNNSNHAHNRYFILNNLTYCGCGEYVTC